MLIRGGHIIDGSNAAPVRADLRIEGARIAEIGANLKAASGEEVVDAGGAYVSPGFIDCHTHFDAPMFWSPTLDPLPGYGTTTVMMGNCGFSVAPMPENVAAGPSFSRNALIRPAPRRSPDSSAAITNIFGPCRAFPPVTTAIL